MEGTTDSMRNFFNRVWSLVMEKHHQGVFNTVCLVVLLTLPLVVLVTTLAVCCHCCCCRHADDGRCRCCRCGGAGKPQSKKKKNLANNDDLWISVKTGQMMPDLVALPME